MHLFVDANTLLGFYGLPKSELEELAKLIALVRAKSLTVCLPEQVIDELYRNRAKVLAEARKVLADARISVSLPAISLDLAERAPLETSLKDTQRRHSDLLKALDAAVVGRTLGADTLLEELVSVAKVVPTSALVERARVRRDLGRPPGKGASIGDQLNWEALLSAVPVGEDLYVVTDDGDFYSAFQRDHISDYLEDEWAREKDATAKTYRDLSKFTREHFPQIVLASDVSKVRAIQELASSGSFAETHAVVTRLAQFDIFSPGQAGLLLAAASTNVQVRWIADDDDVRELLERVIDAHRDSLDPSRVSLLEGLMYPKRQFQDLAAEPLF